MINLVKLKFQKYCRPKLNSLKFCYFIIYQHMDINKDRKFLIYLAVGASLGAAYWIVNYLSDRKIANAKPLQLEKTKKILQEIKYQILTTCTTFVEGLQLKPKTNNSQQDLEIFYRSELAKVYGMREDNTLAKYVVTRDEYAVSLNQYKNDLQIKQGQKEIYEMLEKAIKSIYPDFTVPLQAKNLLTQQQVVQVYLEICELISIKVWQKLDQQKQKNLGFNSKDDIHFKKAVRQLSIYDIKVSFLEKKGFRREWGCPNEVFFKVMESMKQQNKEIKYKAAAIDKAYEKIIDKITKQPQNLNAERIKFIFDEIVNNKAPEKPVPQVQPQPQAPTFSSVKNVAKKVEIAKKEDDFNMDELMMQQLMSRSQEEPKQEKKAQIPLQEDIKAEKINKVQVQLNHEQKEKLASQVKITQQIAVPVDDGIIHGEIKVEKVTNQGNKEISESEGQSAATVQVQNIVEQITAQPNIQEVRVEVDKQEEVKAVQALEEKVQAQQTHAALPEETEPQKE